MDSNQPHHVKKETMFASKWISLQKITWKDTKGVEREYDSAERTTTAPGSLDAVEIVPFIRVKGKEDKYVIVIRQYRPPVNKFTIEFPAGLIDHGESIEDATHRELKEETGHAGKVTFVSSALPPDAGLTNEMCALVEVDIQVDTEQDVHKTMEQCLQDEENIRVFVLPLASLFEDLQKYANEGDLIDAKLYTFAYGLRVAKQCKL